MPTSDKEYLWNLVARKLAGEASEEELRKLDQLLHINPDLHYSIETITDLLQHTHPSSLHIAEEAFFRHLERMRDLKIDRNPDLSNPNPNPNPNANPNTNSNATPNPSPNRNSNPNINDHI